MCFIFSLCFSFSVGGQTSGLGLKFVCHKCQMLLSFGGGAYTDELRDWISSGDNFHIITWGWVAMAVTILPLLLEMPVFSLATLLSFMVKLAGTDGGGISRVWGLVAGNGCTILGGPVNGSTGTSWTISFRSML